MAKKSLLSNFNWFFPRWGPINLWKVWYKWKRGFLISYDINVNYERLEKSTEKSEVKKGIKSWKKCEKSKKR